MTKPPLLSIVTITKNNCAGLGATYSSLLHQSVPFEGNYEWVIVDGESNDNTLLFLSKDGLLEHCVSEPDSGIYDAMNKGLARANGDYLLFLNAGDRLADPETLSLIERHIAAMPSDFIYGDAMEEVNGKLMVKKARSHVRLARGMFTHHQAMIYKRGAIDDLRYDTSYKIAGDYDFTAKFLKNCNDISYIPAPLCLFESGGVSQKNSALGRWEELQVKTKSKVCSRVSAIGIFGMQTAAMTLKKLAPDLYNALRYRKVS